MAQISIRIDDDTKRKAEMACEDMGISISTAINIYLKKLGRERRFTFCLQKILRKYLQGTCKVNEYRI